MNLDERIKFLVQSQESLGKNIERLYQTVTQQGEAIRAHDERLAKLETGLSSLTDLVRQVAQAHIDLADANEEQFSATDQRIDRLAGRTEELVEAGKHTDERLNSLLDVVDKLISRNGSEH